MSKKQNVENEADVIIATKPIKIDDGKHEGKIINVVRNLPNEADGRKYDYLDLEVELRDVERNPVVTVGFPTNISELSQLGRLIQKAGMSFNDGDAIKISDIKDNLEDRNITCLTKNEKTEHGEFARILRDTIEFE